MPGENMLQWGVAVAARLGILDTLLAAGGHPAPCWRMYVGGQLVSGRDFRTMTPHGQGALNIHHPDLAGSAARTRGVAGRTWSSSMPRLGAIRPKAGASRVAGTCGRGAVGSTAPPIRMTRTAASSST
ncbi:MAG TPA: hypothetical protein VFK69_04730 [Candidatus Eisenbacteria bacterium]|nr:hypothetical protein [Candidatus Eisenbacteria bacterium]